MVRLIPPYGTTGTRLGGKVPDDGKVKDVASFITAGADFLDVNKGDDERELRGRGWVGIDCEVGATADRPPEGPLRKAGTVFADTTVGAIIIFDGNDWRNAVTGASV